jgi:hypothetical protein
LGKIHVSKYKTLVRGWYLAQVRTCVPLVGLHHLPGHGLVLNTLAVKLLPDLLQLVLQAGVDLMNSVAVVTLGKNILQ